MQKTIVFNFNILSKGQYETLHNYIKENNENTSFAELNFEKMGNHHYGFCSGTPSWDFYRSIKLTIHPQASSNNHIERKENLNRSLKGLIDIISDFDWDFELADNDSPPFEAIR